MMNATSLGTAVKRLLKEFKEIESAKREHPEDDVFDVHPLADSFLCWHFTLEGPADSVYTGGRFHGRIDFPPDYPFAPPSVYFLTPNGRFDTHVKICLSFTGFHPETWQPAWGVRTMLLALREHFLVEDKGSIGYLNYPEQERQTLARRSRQSSCSECGFNCRPSGEDLASSSSSSETPSRQPRNWISWATFAVLGVLAAYLLFYHLPPIDHHRPHY
jgi:ubiquitin-conjugating enzyme E2 J1